MLEMQQKFFVLSLLFLVGEAVTSHYVHGQTSKLSDILWKLKLNHVHLPTKDFNEQPTRIKDESAKEFGDVFLDTNNKGHIPATLSETNKQFGSVFLDHVDDDIDQFQDGNELYSDMGEFGTLKDDNYNTEQNENMDPQELTKLNLKLSNKYALNKRHNAHMSFSQEQTSMKVSKGCVLKYYLNPVLASQ